AELGDVPAQGGGDIPVGRRRNGRPAVGGRQPVPRQSGPPGAPGPPAPPPPSRQVPPSRSSRASESRSRGLIAAMTGPSLQGRFDKGITPAAESQLNR